MSDIEFESDIDNNPRYNNRNSGASHGANLMSNVYAPSSGASSNVGMANWLVRHGIISSDSGAKVFLIAIVMINFIATGFIMYFYVLH